MEEPDAGLATTCTEFGVEGVDAVREDGGGATPFIRSKISFIRRNFSSILHIEAQRSAISTMARFDLGGKFWWMEQGSDYQLLQTSTTKSLIQVYRYNIGEGL